MIALLMIVGGCLVLVALAVSASVEAHRAKRRTRALEEDLQTVSQVMLIVARAALDHETVEKLTAVDVLGWTPRDDLVEIRKGLSVEDPAAEPLRLLRT